MKHLLTIFTVVCVLFFTSCRGASGQRVRISTPHGDIVVRLYDDTPKHSENFLTLAREGEYNDLLFHRVIRNFMMQGGDPDSRIADPNARLGQNQIGGPIDAEIVYPKHFHKYGALAAARKGDQFNPNKMSSGSQFYIVKGEVLTDSQLDAVEERMNDRKRQQIFYEIQKHYSDSLIYYQNNKMQSELVNLQIHIMGKTEELLKQRGEFRFTPEQREAYTTVGGSPHLDGEYTVFGEVVEGFEVIDSICAQPVYSPGDRPMKDIWMRMEVIE